jgi:hypothetical protein
LRRNEDILIDNAPIPVYSFDGVLSEQAYSFIPSLVPCMFSSLPVLELRLSIVVGTYILQMT